MPLKDHKLFSGHNYVISNRDLRASSGISSTSRELVKRRWKWIGHVLHLDHDENPHIALTWTSDGKQRRG